MICAQCFVNLTVANKFWKKVQESHEKLKEIEQCNPLRHSIHNPLSMKSEDPEIHADEVLGDYEDMLAGAGEEDHYMVYERDQDIEDLRSTTIEIEEIVDENDKKNSKVKLLTFSESNDEEHGFLVVKSEIKPSTMKKESKVKNTYSDPHICEICGNSFKSKSILNLHMRRHQNIRPFKCE